ncbi:MAG: HD domain-containing protein [Balneolaceae bacterium]
MPDNSSNGASIPSKRICAIDLGTNSFHAVIVDIFPDGSFRTVDKLKEMVILAERGMEGRLSEDAMQRGLEALKKIKILSDSQGVEQILAYATSAIREAENGGDFIQQAIDEVGVKPLAISGKKEAELIGYAVQHAVSLGQKPVLMVDIGGGSVEFIVGNKHEFFYTASKKIGVARTAAKFITTDPVNKKEKKAMKAFFKKELEDLTEVLERYPVDTIVGSSGTMENMAAMIANRNSISTSISLNEMKFTDKEYKKFYKWCIKLNRKERLGVKGLEEKRVDIIAPGLVLLRLLMKKFNIKRIKISEEALREGIILQYIKKQKDLLDLDLVASHPDPRERSVYELLRKCDWHEKHSTHVADMALALFDELMEDLDLPETDRELLRYAALMHDIGYYISHRKHHKHALYLIRHADLRGFREEEIEIMANVARYHRRSSPKSRHKYYDRLDKELQDRIKKMSGILRVADGLDRSHFQNVQKMEIERKDSTIRLNITTEADPQLEVWGARRKSQLFEEVTGKKLEIVPVGVAEEV